MCVCELKAFEENLIKVTVIFPSKHLTLTPMDNYEPLLILGTILG